MIDLLYEDTHINNHSHSHTHNNCNRGCNSSHSSEIKLYNKSNKEKFDSIEYFK